MKRIDSINVIPFIDVMLVLLAIVLTTATFIVEGRLEIRLPESQAQNTLAPVEPLDLAIDREGKLFLGADPTTLDGLRQHLAAVSSETPVVLRVDQDARFAQFVAIVDLLKSREMDKLTILTKRVKQ